MAYYFIFPETDTTIYSHPDRKTMNAGSDELLELVKEQLILCIQAGPYAKIHVKLGAHEEN